MFTKINFLTAASAAAILLTGCNSTVVNAHRQKREMMDHYVSGRYRQALEEVEHELRPPSIFNTSKVNSIDEVMWRVEAGALNCIVGNDARSIEHFTRAEELIEDFDGRAIVNLREAGSETAGVLTNPNALPYRGWCRDRIMIPVYKAFAYLGRSGEAEFHTELYNLRFKQDDVVAKYEKFFEAENAATEKAKRDNSTAASSFNPDTVMKNSRNGELSNALGETDRVAHRGYANFLNPVAIFLSAYGYLRKSDYQNAIVDCERLYKALPGNPTARLYYANCLRLAGRDVPEELKNVPPFEFRPEARNVLVVFANGRGAALKQIALYIPLVIPGYATVASVAWPVCEFYPAPYACLDIAADGKGYRTGTIADMDGILAAEYKRRLPGMIVRICLSTAVKEIGSYVATRAAAQADPWAGLAVAVGTTIYKVTFNTADTRAWELLPKEFQIAQFPMPQDHKLVLTAGGIRTTVDIPPTAGSAIVLIHAPGGPGSDFSYRVFPLKN